MQTVETLIPFSVWHYFNAISKIPRPSKHEEQIIKYIVDFAIEKKLEYKKDAIGNILISKPGSSGKENLATVVLQSHLDMVCEKNANVMHDFMTDPINIRIDGEWVKANGTTLGADDGIGIATMLAILDDNSIEHGPLECLFTVDEETGLTGAFELSPEFFSGKTLINLDSEDEGELFIGCAGGIDTQATFYYKSEKVKTPKNAYRINITGLQGGHSGDEIHLGLGNAIKMMTEFLFYISQSFEYSLNRFDGGNLKNAIPRESFAVIVFDTSNETLFLKIVEKYIKSIPGKFIKIEPNWRLITEKVDCPDIVLDSVFQSKLLKVLNDCPDGVIAWSSSIPGLVETSTNLASIKFENPSEVLIVTSQRSSVEKSKKDIANRIAGIFYEAGGSIKHSAGYPGWEPNLDSAILKMTRDLYFELFNEKPQVKAIHAGLECGLFLEKYQKLDMISFGPTIKGAHSPDERLLIVSVQKFWVLLLEVLKHWV